VFFFGALPILFVPFLAKSLPDSVGTLINNNDFKEIQKIFVKLNADYKPSENETFVLNKQNENSSPVKNLLIKKRRSKERSEAIQSRFDLVCRLLLEKKKKQIKHAQYMFMH